jgi:hypothetical protein
MTRKLLFRIAGLWLVIGILSIFSVSLYDFAEPVSIMTFPQVPTDGMPITVAFKLKNYELNPVPYSFKLFANGKKVVEGEVLLEPFSGRDYRYVYPDSVKLGDQITFTLLAENSEESFEKVISVPPYHPHVWTSFVSFASFSTSMAGMVSTTTTTTTTTITSMAYYSDAFGARHIINVGVIFSLVLIGILIHVEVTEPFTNSRHILGRLRRRFTRVSVILFIIFIAMVFTQVALILSWV